MLITLFELLISTLTLLSMWLAGNKSVWAWRIGLVNQIFWFILIIGIREAWGLLPLSIGITIIYSRNLYKWSRQTEVS